MATRSKPASQPDDTEDAGAGSADATGSAQSVTGQVMAARQAAGAVAARSAEAMGVLGEWCLNKAQTTDVDQYDVMANMVAEILAADNLADALTKKMPRHAKDYVDKPFVMTGFTIREGEYEDGPLPFYAAIDAVDPDSGVGFVITCGGVKTMAQLMKMEFEIQREDTDDQWPQVVMLAGTKTSKGYTTLDLVRP